MKRLHRLKKHSFLTCNYRCEFWLVEKLLYAETLVRFIVPNELSFSESRFNLIRLRSSLNIVNFQTTEGPLLFDNDSSRLQKDYKDVLTQSKRVS